MDESELIKNLRIIMLKAEAFDKIFDILRFKDYDRDGWIKAAEEWLDSYSNSDYSEQNFSRYL